MEQAVGIASMVNSDKLQMSIIAQEVERAGYYCRNGGAEAEAAILGALTTPGTDRPLAISGLGSGLTDASIIDSKGQILAVHLAGAGDMVTMLTNSELGFENHHPAEDIKRYPLAKVESLFISGMKTALFSFYRRCLRFVTESSSSRKMMNLFLLIRIEKIKLVRVCQGKSLVTNAVRALKRVALLRIFETFLRCHRRWLSFGL